MGHSDKKMTLCGTTPESSLYRTRFSIRDRLSGRVGKTTQRRFTEFGIEQCRWNHFSRGIWAESIWRAVQSSRNTPESRWGKSI